MSPFSMESYFLLAVVVGAVVLFLYFFTRPKNYRTASSNSNNNNNTENQNVSSSSSTTSSSAEELRLLRLKRLEGASSSIKQRVVSPNSIPSSSSSPVFKDQNATSQNNNNKNNTPVLNDKTKSRLLHEDAPQKKAAKSSMATSTKTFEESEEGTLLGTNDGTADLPPSPTTSSQPNPKPVPTTTVMMNYAINDFRPTTIPLSSLAQVMNWMPSDPFNRSTLPLRPRAVLKTLTKPRMLVCHDMMGGYVQDKYPQGDAVGNIYRLYDWQVLDTFVYFSHNLVTIPPPGWTHCAHQNGVTCLGTFITEWDAGAKACSEFLTDDVTCKALADKLVAIATYYGFDGWLINIENKIDLTCVDRLRKFCAWVCEGMHKVSLHACVLWYDSVLADGSLRWQNELTTKNKMFFDACDGIFLNYNYSPANLSRSYALAPTRARDIYVGIDVFGRGTYGGGNWTCNVAVAAIMQANLSIALFAPGWVYENFPKIDFEANQVKFWSLLTGAGLYTHALCGLPLVSSFDVGCGESFSLDGKIQSTSAWSQLQCQSVLPTEPLSASNPYYLGPGGASLYRLAITHDMSAGYNGGSSLRASGSILPSANPGRAVLRLFQTDLPFDGPLVVGYTHAFVSGRPHVDVSLMLVLAPADGSPVRYLVCGAAQGRPSRAEPIDANLRAKYALIRSPSTVEADGYLCLDPVDPDPLVSLGGPDPQVGSPLSDGASMQWVTRYFVICEQTLRNRRITEVRVALVPTPSSDAIDVDLRLGQVTLFEPKALRAVPKDFEVASSSVDFHREVSGLSLSATLSWSLPPDELEGVAYFQIFAKRKGASSFSFLGRAYNTLYRVYHCPVGDDKEVLLSVQAVTTAMLRVPVAESPSIRLKWI